MEPRRQRQRIERREQILQGGRLCFAGQGFHATSIDQLEQACGVTRRTLFKYFPSKAALLQAITRQESERRRAQFQQVLDVAAQERDLALLFIRVALAQVELSQQDPASLQLRLELLRLASTEQHLRQQAEQDELEERRWRRELVRQVQERGLIHADWDLELATDLISAALLGLATHCSYAMPIGRSASAQAQTLGLSLARLLQEPMPQRGEELPLRESPRA